MKTTQKVKFIVTDFVFEDASKFNSCHFGPNSNSNSNDIISSHSSFVAFAQPPLSLSKHPSFLAPSFPPNPLSHSLYIF